MTGFPYICGEDISAINNKEFIRIETDKAQAIVIALDKSDIPYSARFRDTEMVLTFDGSYREQVESIITKAMSGDYEALLCELQVYGVPDGYYRLLGDFWLCDDASIQRELDRVISVNGRTVSDIQEHEKIKTQKKAPTAPTQDSAEKVRTFAELFENYQRRNANDYFTREAHKHLAEIARRRQSTEQERTIQTEELERKNRP